MNIIIVGKRHGESRTFALNGAARLAAICVLAVLPFAMGATGYYMAAMFSDNEVFNNETAQVWEQSLDKQRSELESIRNQTAKQLEGLTLRMAELQAKLTRLDALGERLVDNAKLDKEEFNFATPPAVGGPGTNNGIEVGEAYQAPDIISVLDQLAEQIDNREEQLEVLDSLMDDQRLQNDTFIAGRPILKGWMSSRYGKRTDPFTGRLAWHAGVDFAGRDGSDIVAVASGVVTWADERYGYGLMVEVSHGGGYKTRYAHAKSLDVKYGDIVRKGQVIAKMGSSGRSTGPHVHFEVYKNGRTVDPAQYIHRTAR